MTINNKYVHTTLPSAHLTRDEKDNLRKAEEVCESVMHDQNNCQTKTWGDQRPNEIIAATSHLKHALKNIEKGGIELCGVWAKKAWKTVEDILTKDASFLAAKDVFPPAETSNQPNKSVEPRVDKSPLLNHHATCVGWYHSNYDKETGISWISGCQTCIKCSVDEALKHHDMVCHRCRKLNNCDTFGPNALTKQLRITDFNRAIPPIP